MQAKTDCERRERIYPDRAVVILQSDFERFAAQLRRCDLALRDDLVQEMSLGVLQCREPHTLSFFKSRGVSRAKDFLRMRNRRMMLDWSEVRAEPIDNTVENNARRDFVLDKITALLGGNESKSKDPHDSRKTCA
jgi:hypothetical protein